MRNINRVWGKDPDLARAYGTIVFGKTRASSCHGKRHDRTEMLLKVARLMPLEYEGNKISTPFTCKRLRSSEESLRIVPQVQSE